MPCEETSSKVSQERNSHKTDSNNRTAAMLAVALSSADRVVRDLNLAHSKKSKLSSADSASSRVHTKTKALHGRSQK